MDDYDAGKAFAQNKALELMDEVIAEYNSQCDKSQNRMKDKGISWDGTHTELQAQLNAVKFMKSWVISGGHQDEDGNRAVSYTHLTLPTKRIV